MQAIRDYLRLGVGGLFLDLRVYREQRDDPNSLQRGFVLVALIGLLVGFATMVGRVLQWLVTPDSATLQRTIYEGLTAMPWYARVSENVPGFADQFPQQFEQIFQLIQLLGGRSDLSGALFGVILTPLAYLLGWLIFGCFAHLMARLMGGEGALAQTLGCIALATGANLLAVVQVVPFAQVAGVTLLGLVASYVALREVHRLAPWRAFWATLLGPLLLVLLFACGVFVFVFLLGSIVGA